MLFRSQIVSEMTEKEGRLDGSGDSQPVGGQLLTDSNVISESTVIIEGPDVLSDDDGNFIITVKYYLFFMCAFTVHVLLQKKKQNKKKHKESYTIVCAILRKV